MVTGIEVTLNKPIRIIKDTLERIGIANRKEKKLFPSCYLVIDEETGKSYISHFKELLNVNGAVDSDLLRRNTIVWLLSNWKLVDIVNPDEVTNIQKKKLFILNKEQKKEENWKICHKWHYLKTNQEEEVHEEV